MLFAEEGLVGSWRGQLEVNKEILDDQGKKAEEIISFSCNDDKICWYAAKEKACRLMVVGRDPKCGWER